MNGSLAFNSSDLPRVASCDRASGAPKNALWNGSTRSFATVIRQGKGCGQGVLLWIDETDTVWIAYPNETDESIGFAYPSIAGHS